MRRLGREAVQRFFDATPESIGLARDFTTATLSTWGLTASAEDVRICVSELAANALVHGTEPGYGFLIRLDVEDEFIRLEVHDSRGQAPRVRHPADTEPLLPETPRHPMHGPTCAHERKQPWKLLNAPG